MDQTMPIPIADHDSEPFWEFCNQGELRVQSCDACGELRFPPRAMCPRCHAVGGSWVPMSGRGTIYSWVVAHHPVSRLVEDKVPYVVAVVELEEGPRMVSRVTGISPEEIAGGMPVEVSFETIADGVKVPNVRPG